MFERCESRSASLLYFAVIFLIAVRAALGQEPATSSAPENLVIIGDYLYFSADDGKHGRELWVCETSTGRGRYFDLEAGVGSSNPGVFQNCGGRALFIATTSKFGSEAWLFDPAHGEPRLFQDFAPGPASSIIQLCGAGGETFYLYTQGLGGRSSAIWGIHSNTLDLARISIVGRMDEFNGTQLDDGRIVVGTLNDLLITNTLVDGSSQLLHLEIPGSVGWITSIGTRVVFAAGATDVGEELYYTDGTPEGTGLVRDICPGPKGAAIQQVCRWGERAVFQADDGQTGPELWLTDGTAAGTRLVADIFPGAEGSDPHYFLPLEDRVYFAATNGASGVELWRTDGTEAGTVRVSDLAPGEGAGALWSLVPFQEKVYFCANSRVYGEEIFYATPADDVFLLADIVPGIAGCSPGNLTASRRNLFFTCNHGDYGEELWWTDGGTKPELLLDIRVQQQEHRLSARPAELSPFGGDILFVATDLEHGRELWRSDGTAAGTVLVADIVPGGGDASPGHIVVDKGRAFFTADTPETGREIWLSDGTATGTMLVADVVPGPADANPRNLRCHEGALYFLAGPADQASLWRTDLHADAAAQLIVMPDAPDGGVDGLFALADALYIHVGVQGRTDLYRLDGNVATPAILPDGSAPASLDEWLLDRWPPAWLGLDAAVVAMLYPTGREWAGHTPTLFRGATYFAGYTQACGTEPWIYCDVQGFRMLRDLFPGRASSGPSDMVVVGKDLCFIAEHPERGRVLWESDGTDGGTRVLRAMEGNGATWPPLAPVMLRDAGNDCAALLAPHPHLGEPGMLELGILSWASGEFTFRICPRTPGDVSINPEELACAGGKVFFVCDESVYGEELWVYDLNDGTTRLARDILSLPEPRQTP